MKSHTDVLFSQGNQGNLKSASPDNVFLRESTSVHRVLSSIPLGSPNVFLLTWVARHSQMTEGMAGHSEMMSWDMTVKI